MSTILLPTQGACLPGATLLDASSLKACSLDACSLDALHVARRASGTCSFDVCSPDAWLLDARLLGARPHGAYSLDASVLDARPPASRSHGAPMLGALGSCPLRTRLNGAGLDGVCSPGALAKCGVDTRSPNVHRLGLRLLDGTYVLGTCRLDTRSHIACSAGACSLAAWSSGESSIDTDSPGMCLHCLLYTSPSPRD